MNDYRRTVLITGAGSGIGASVARNLAEPGAGIVVMGRRPEPLEEVASAVRLAGAEAVVSIGDVRLFADVERAVATAVSNFGRLDVLVANAGIPEGGPISSANPDVYRDVIETNVLGVLFSIRAALPQMIEQGFGHVVVMASVSGRVNYVGEPAYIASKHATVAFAECLRQEVAATGIRVSVIEPGIVETPLLHALSDAPDVVPGVSPLDPGDCARAVRFVIDQPPNVNIAELVLRPTAQVL